MLITYHNFKLFYTVYLNGRNVRQISRSLSAGESKDDDFVVRDLPAYCGIELEGDIDIATQKRGRHVGRCSERHDRHLNVGHIPEELSGQILGTPVIDGSDLQSFLVHTRHLDDFLNVFMWPAWPGIL